MKKRCLQILSASASAAYAAVIHAFRKAGKGVPVIALILIAAFVLPLALPLAARADHDDLGKGHETDNGSGGGGRGVGKGVGGAAGCLASLAAGLISGLISGVTAVAVVSVPVSDPPNLIANNTSAGSTSAAETRSVVNCLMTAIAKAVIVAIRDTVIRWIMTGNFEKPVFSVNFSADLRRIASNAVRGTLQRFSNLPFCSGISMPPQVAFSLDAEISLACDQPTAATLRIGGDVSALDRLAISEQTRYSQEDVWVMGTDMAMRAQSAAKEEYLEDRRAGQGFLSITDKNGNITTPGSAVAKLVMESQIVSSIRQADVADDIQSAVAAIVDAAIMTLMNKGLGAVGL